MFSKILDLRDCWRHDHGGSPITAREPGTGLRPTAIARTAARPSAPSKQPLTAHSNHIMTLSQLTPKSPQTSCSWPPDRVSLG